MLNLKTGWLTVGRSGATVDNRTIDPAMILDAAETYDVNLYAAMIWPEHFRFANYGRVEQVRSMKNEEGGYDLQAILAPNEFYISSRSFDQKIYTSMELLENFRGTGKYYLTGLGATDSPASAGLSEVRFSREPGNILYSIPQEIQIYTKTEKSLLGRLFGQDKDTEAAMDKEALKALMDELKGLRQEFSTPANPDDKKPDDPAWLEKFAALEKKVDELAVKFAQPAQPPAAADSDSFKVLTEKLDALEQKFSEALKTPHPNGTQPPVHTGTDGDRNDYL